MNENERKEVEELAKQIWADSLSGVNKYDAFPWHQIPDDHKYPFYKLAKKGYTKRPQDNNPEEGETKNDIAFQHGYSAGVKANNALVPLDSELLAEYLFKTKEIQSTMLQSKTGCQFFADLVCAKFGKDNSGMVSLELIKELELLKSYFEDRKEGG